jgi:dihydrofolate reductase
MEMIVAMCKNNGIGKDNQLVWNIPEDLMYFLRMTKNSIVIMGYNTYLSIPEKYRPLPYRLNIVLTMNKSILGKTSDQLIFSNKEDIPKYIEEYKNKYLKCFVIGGQQIYKQFLDQVDLLHITYIEKHFDCDSYFPNYTDKFALTETSERKWSEDEQCYYSFQTHRRVK